MGRKPKTLQNVIELSKPFESSPRADNFSEVGCKNRIKNGRVMPTENWGKSGVLAFFLAENWLIWPHFLRYGRQFFLPFIHINLKSQAQLKVNWTQIDHYIPFFLDLSSNFFRGLNQKSTY